MAQLSEEERAAQRVVVGMFNGVNHVLGPTRAALWTDDEYKDPEEVAACLAVLGVFAGPEKSFKPPRAKSSRLRWGHEVVIDADGLALLADRWLPSLEERLAALPAHAVNPHEFALIRFAADAVLMVAMKCAMDWPRWSLPQMQRARLLCAECERDPRRPEVGGYQLADSTGRFRFYCGKCADQRRPGMVPVEHLG